MSEKYFLMWMSCLLESLHNEKYRVDLKIQNRFLNKCKLAKKYLNLVDSEAEFCFTKTSRFMNAPSSVRTLKNL